MRKVIVLKTEEFMEDFNQACRPLELLDDIQTEVVRGAVRKALHDYECVSNKMDPRGLFGIKFDAPCRNIPGISSASGEWTKTYYDFVIQYNLLSLRLLGIFQKESIPMIVNPISGDLYCPYDFGGVVFDHIHLTTSVSQPAGKNQT